MMKAFKQRRLDYHRDRSIAAGRKRDKYNAALDGYDTGGQHLWPEDAAYLENCVEHYEAVRAKHVNKIKNLNQES